MTESSESNVHEFKVGLTWRSILAMVIAAAIFIPTSLYSTLAAGTTVAAAGAYVIIILFSEFTRIFGRPLLKQELFIMYQSIFALTGSLPIYYWLIYRGFFVQNPITRSIEVNGIPLPKLVPQWLAPPFGSEAYELRTLIHSDWAMATMMATAMLGLGLMTDIALGMLLSYLSIEVEELRFPMASVDAAMVNTLTERKTDSMKPFLSSLIVGITYGFLLYSPLITGISLIPLPWVDLTQLTQWIVPGALIGFLTDPGSFLLGTLLPLNVTSCILIGSVACWIVANSLFITTFPQVFPDWPREYYSGMSLTSIYQRSLLRVWVAPQFGFILGLTIFLAIRANKGIIKTFKALLKPTQTLRATTGFLPIPVLLTLYLVSTATSSLLYHWFVPDVPMIIPIAYSLGFSFLTALLTARLVGELGISIGWMPHLWQTMVYFSPYNGVAGWIFTPALGGLNTGGYANITKGAYLTDTRPGDFYKSVVLTTILSVCLGFIFMDYLWRIAPIPSVSYPFTLVQFPLSVMYDSFWITRQVNLDPHIIMSSAGISFLIGILGLTLPKFGIPLDAVALIGGVLTIPPYAIMMLAGSVLSKILARRLGKSWERIRVLVFAGVLLGQGIMVGIGISVMLVAKAAWILPW